MAPIAIGNLASNDEEMNLAASALTRNSVATRLGQEERKKLSVEVLARNEPVVRLAARNNVSRKFAYKQADIASEALDAAFAPTSKDEDVLFYLPVTKRWIRQFVLTLILTCHSSYRGIIDVLRDVFDYKISLGSIHNILQENVEKARVINAEQDLSSVRVGALDEIFQSGKPVLVGMDVHSTYCFLLAYEDHRDETTWGVHLLELAEQQNLWPDHTVADAGSGLRAGQNAAWEGQIPCHGDVFHALRQMGKLVIFLENRAAGATKAREKLEAKMERAKNKGQGQKLSKKLAMARQGETKAVSLAQDVRILYGWMRNDILSLAGPAMATRVEMFDFIVEELNKLEPLCRHRIKPVRRALENQRDDLLGFVRVLDALLAEIADRFDIPIYLVHAICDLKRLDKASVAYWTREKEIRRLAGAKFYQVEKAVSEAMNATTRASSIVENLNSRLRCYFFLRRQLGNDYLNLLQFFLNHRKFNRSERPERVGKSPAELLNGEPHPHWLEMLGFKLFKQN